MWCPLGSCANYKVETRNIILCCPLEVLWQFISGLTWLHPASLALIAFMCTDVAWWSAVTTKSCHDYLTSFLFASIINLLMKQLINYCHQHLYFWSIYIFSPDFLQEFYMWKLIGFSAPVTITLVITLECVSSCKEQVKPQ